MQQLLDEPLLIKDNELPPLDENEEEMKLREDDKTWLRDEIKAAMQEVLAEGIEPLVDRRIEKSWRHKSWPLLRNVGAITSVVTVVLTLFIFALTEHSEATARIGVEKEFEGGTTQRLNDIDKHLLALDNTLSGVKTVSQVSSALFDAQQKGQKLSSEVLDRLGKSVEQSTLKNPDMDGLWQTASTLISYRYANNDQDRPVHSPPDCWDHHVGHVFDGIAPPSLPAPPDWPAIDEQRIANCELTLDDGPKFRNSEFGKAYEQNLRDYPASKLLLNAHDVVVTYSGGKPIPYYQLLCNHCVFRTVVRGVPSPQGQHILRNLLIADTSKVELSQSGE